MDPLAGFFTCRWNWRSLLVIAVLGFAAYAPTLNVGFLWDDHVIIENNPTLTQWNWKNIRHDFLADNTLGMGDNYYRPLQAFGYRLEYPLWGQNPAGYHLTDILVHLANGGLIFYFLMALGIAPWAALMTACLFVVHPIGIEQFLTASGRTTPLSFFFVVSCLYLLLKPTPLRHGIGLLCFGLALLTKEISVIAPLLLALTFYYQRITGKRWWILLPMGLILFLYFYLRQRAVHYIVGPLEPSRVTFFLIKVFPRILAHYAALLVWPWNLHSHRLIPHLSHLWLAYLIGLLGSVVWLARKSNRTGLFCLGWYVLWLLPTIPVMMRGSFMLDHWGYSMAPGLLLPISLVLSKAWQSPLERTRKWAGSLFFALVIAYALLVHLNVALRGTDEKMYRWALHFTTSSPIKYNLGIVLLETGRPAEAVIYFEDVRCYYPDDANLARALTKAYWTSGRPFTAIGILKEYLHRHPENTRLNQLLINLTARLPPHPPKSSP
jgi:hypothetical protein